MSKRSKLILQIARDTSGTLGCLFRNNSKIERETLTETTINTNDGTCEQQDHNKCTGVETNASKDNCDATLQDQLDDNNPKKNTDNIEKIGENSQYENTIDSNKGSIEKDPEQEPDWKSIDEATTLTLLRSSPSSNSSRRSSSSNSSSKSKKNRPLSNSNYDINSDDSFADPDFEVGTSTSSDGESDDDESLATGQDEDKENERKSKRRKVSYPREEKKNERKKISNPASWRKNIAKQLRNSGKSYESSSKSKKKFKSREIQPQCNDKCRLRCFEKITQDQREIIFQDYWNMGNIQRQREFLLNSMTAVIPQYRYTRENSNRRQNNAFHFDIMGKKVRVCKVFFKATLAINDRPIRTVIEKKSFLSQQMISEDLRRKHNKHPHVDEGIKEGVRNFIKMIPRIESHYCRSQTTKEYIDGGKSIAQIHRDYTDQCREQKLPTANYVMFSRIFNQEFNISFFSPKKDQCELCNSYKNSNDQEKLELRIKYDARHEEKKLSRLEEENDKKSESIVAVYDLHAILPCPRGDVSTYYYSSKLNVFNLTVFNLNTTDVQCYVWHEGQANRGVNEIGSCILRYLQDQNQKAVAENKIIDIVFYSDNCARQQKNRFMFSMYSYAVSQYENINSITHKYLITGHSQNEGDSAHSVIERHITRSLKFGPILIPEQYVSLIRTAKKSGKPYRVHELSYEDFFDLKELTNDLNFINFSKNSEGDIFKISDVKIIKLIKDHPGKMYYKDSYKESEFKVIDLVKRKRKGGEHKEISLKNAYQQKVGITDKKKKVLLSLFKKNSISKCYFDYYNAL